MERVEHQQGVAELIGSIGAELGVVEHLDKRRDVIAAKHGAQKLHRERTINQRRRCLSLGDRGEKARFDISCLVNPRWYAVRQ